jgi:microcin C transport system substrate-binding protein
MKPFTRTIVLFLIVAIIGGFGLTGYAIQLSNVPVGDPHAIRGGELNLQTSDFPKSFNYFVNTAVDTAAVFGLVYDNLMSLNYNTLEFEPLIAKSITVSADKKLFTVKIDPRAKWADGKPITAKDLLFTYDVIMNPKNLTSVQRMSYIRFNRPKVIDKYTIEFLAKTVHYHNFVAVAEFTPLPEHLFAGKDFNKAFNMSLPAGSGPYVLSEVKEGRYFVLTRRKNYWADQLPSRRGMYNFDRVKYKVIRDENVAFEAFKKGDFDTFSVSTGKRWATDTHSERFQKNWIIRQKIYNYTPRIFGGLALNLRRPIFKDLRVRQALNHLLDRKTIIEKLEYNQFIPTTSYFPTLYGPKQANPVINYDPVLAKKLLTEAGYTRLDKEGYLLNSQGERLEFTLTYPLEDYEKYYTQFASDCRKVGVKVNLELVSWATMIKRMDEYKFDTVSIFWNDELFSEGEEQLWHSKHVDEVGGSNLCGYKNPEVDRLIDSMAPIFDVNQRNEITKKIDRILYRDMPYILFWSNDSVWILYKNVFGMPKTVFPKYSTGIVSYWWFDPQKVKRYQEALKKNQALPGVPTEVYYDQAITK